MSRIFIVGAGVVGAATGRALLRCGHRVTFVDVAPERVAALVAEGLDARPAIDLDGEPESFVFFCLPTGLGGRGYRLSVVEDGAEEIGRALAGADTRHTVVIRSAVPPGTTEQLIRPLIERYSAKREGMGFALAVCPQFARPAPAGAATALAVPGAEASGITVIAARSRHIAHQVRDLLAPLSSSVRLFDDPATAELIKCTDSLVNATKISFWNEIWQVCQLLDLNPDEVAEAVAGTAEGSVDPLFGIRGGAPYGGRLPRDTRGFLDFAAELGLPMPLLSAVVGVNTEFEWRMAAELDGVGPLSAIPRSRPELRSAPQDDPRPDNCPADQFPATQYPADEYPATQYPADEYPGRSNPFNPDEAFRPDAGAPPLPRRPRPPARPAGSGRPRIPRQRIR